MSERPEQALPTGTVTFLFTDVEGSTQTVAALGDARYAELQESQRSLLREAFSAHSGVVVFAEGDALFVAFAKATDAAAAALEGQNALESHAWPEGRQLRVRMGLHTGEAIVRDGDYVGQDVNRAKRICDSGHGGQILVSQSTAELVSSRLRSGSELNDLGTYGLKDFPGSHRIFQLTEAQLQRDFAVLRGSDGAGSAGNEREQGRQVFAEHRWSDAVARFTAADREAELDIDDLERLAEASYLIGDEGGAADAWTRAHHEALRRGEPARAAHCAFWHACGLLFRGDMAPAMGWIARGGRILEESGEDCVERAWFLTLTNLPVLFSGDPATAYPNFLEAAEIARRFDDPNAVTMSRLALGQAEIMMGRPKEGFGLLDEVMVAVTTGEVSAIFAGICYCAVIDACQRLFDLRRAREWTAALSRWCDAQPDLVPYRGNCLIHRCEIFQLQGAWPDAMIAAERACETLAGPPTWDSLGSAFYQLGEIQRLRGDFAGAEESYRRASQAGREPEPGMSLIRLAQGRVDVAAAAIRRVLDDTHDPPSRSRVLPASVEIMLEAGDVGAARACANELGEIATMLDAPLLHALAAHADGAVLVVESDARAGLSKLREASVVWRQLDAPHEAARVRVLMGLARRALGDDAGADMEFEAAREDFEQLGAEPDLARLKEIYGPKAPKTSGGLSPREVEVLRLVATGRTNRAIASELVLSEKTVARHISNIFTKLGISSRAAATAYAYENGLA